MSNKRVPEVVGSIEAVSKHLFNEETLIELSQKPGSHADPETPGLSLFVSETSTGLKSQWRFRIQIRGRRLTRTIANFPETPLKEARERAKLCRTIFMDCFDLTGPFADLIACRDSPKTVEALWAQWVKSEERRGASTAKKPYKDALARGKNHVFKDIGNMAPSEVKVADVARILNTAYERLHASTVKKLRQDIGKFFRWCHANALIDQKAPLPTNPELLSALLCRPARRIAGNPHPALGGKDVKRLVEYLLSEKFAKRTASMALLFTLLTASRIGNVIGSLDRELTQPARWSDFNKKLTLWTIDADNMKMGHRNGNHVVPLSEEARLVLLVMKRRQEKQDVTSEIVFGTHHGKRFDYRLLPLLIKQISASDLCLGENGFVDEITGKRFHAHGLRSTFKTWGTDHGIDWTLTELALHHSIDKLRYDRARAITRRRKIMQQWADFCFTDETRARLRELAGVADKEIPAPEITPLLLLPPPSKSNG